jgi:uncharacterized protein YecT (DUF1311 family)
MRARRILAVVLASLAGAACDPGTTDETASAIARDSALEADLKLAAADTAPFSEAADVAVANAPSDSESSAPPLDSIPTSSPATNRVPTTRVAEGDVAMRSSSTPGASTTRATRPAPESERPPAGAATRAASGASSRPASASAESYAGASCASPALADQRRCLLSYLARSDVTLDRNYQALITQLKRRAGTRPGAKEPETVERLRVAQRAWLVYRDQECRKRNQGKEGPLWAPTRAECLSEFSGQRAKELSSALAKLNGS